MPKGMARSSLFGEIWDSEMGARRKGDRRKRIRQARRSIPTRRTRAISVIGQMDEFFSRAWSQLLARPTGPFQFRFILQPLMAVILGVRAGMKDARTHRSPYFQRLRDEPSERGALLRSGLKDVGRLFFIAVVLDCVYQVIEIRWIYPLQAVIVGFVLAVIPYAGVRGPANRLANRMIVRRD